MTSRRGFLAGLLATGLCPRPTWADAGNPAYLAAARLPDRSYHLLGLSARGEQVFGIPLPDRGHAAAAHPKRPEAVAFARRPGTFAVVIDCAAGRRRAVLHAPEGRHFYGHGAFSADGGTLFTTENDYGGARGVVGVWDVASGYLRIGEFPSGGIGPHEIRLMPDGDTLVVANGGIETHPDSGRAKLNLPLMRPVLSYAALDGRLLEQVTLAQEFNKNSIRHIAVGPDGLVAFAMQWQGRAGARPPLLGLHRPGEKAHLLGAPEEDHRRLEGYAGSVAFSPDGGQVAITSPRGGAVQVFDAHAMTYAGQYLRADACGVSPGEAGFVVTSGLGVVEGLLGNRAIWQVSHGCQWDNHLVPVDTGGAAA